MTRSVRPIRTEGNVAFITLTKGYVAMIDAADMPMVESWNWCANVKRNTIYAKRGERIDGKSHKISLHRVIMDPPAGIEVDHIDGNGLDCRRSNMRLATRSQNNCNMRISCVNTSGFKGVHWVDYHQKWRAMIQLRGKQTYLGIFASPEEAHAAYCEASERLHGEFGRTQ